MGGGDKRRLRRQRQLGEQDTGQKNSPAFIAFALLVAGFQTGGIWAEEIPAALDRLYCTPEFCLALPQALIGWAIAVAPLLVLLWRRDVAIYSSAFLAGLMGMLLIASDGSWVVPSAFFGVGLVFVPISLAISRLAKPGWRAVAVAGQHWLLLAGLILWLA
ncbi:hypothetical protein [Lentzea sp. NPDC004782]|uniref:hypothetical protein n=1 Tax=Lentzea sp. NPDC004782 TaxID=3154458 RepID=UPI0033B22596